MLYNKNCNVVTNIPHRPVFNRWMKKLSMTDYQAVVNALNDYCDKAKEMVKSSYIPGKVWQAPYDTLHIACNGDEQQAAFFFGLLLWTVIQQRRDEWVFWRVEKGDGMIYFRK
ncbi:MAG: hypothetical protein WCJ56_00315 [bacterium]